jgi:hypothetical protein
VSSTAMLSPTAAYAGLASPASSKPSYQNPLVILLTLLIIAVTWGAAARQRIPALLRHEFRLWTVSEALANAGLASEGRHSSRRLVFA